MSFKEAKSEEQKVTGDLLGFAMRPNKLKHEMARRAQISYPIYSNINALLNVNKSFCLDMF